MQERKERLRRKRRNKDEKGLGVTVKYKLNTSQCYT